MKPVLALRGVSRSREGGWKLEPIHLTLRYATTSAVVGPNEAGKTTLAAIALADLEPADGSVALFGEPLAPRGAAAALGDYLAYAPHALALSAAIACALSLRLGLLVATLAALAALWLRRYASHQPGKPGWASDAMRARGVAYISSEHYAGQALPENATIEEVIAQHMPLSEASARRREVVAALRASGFQLFSDAGTRVGSPEEYVASGIKVGGLSGGQRHLVYILAVLASRPRLLIADEMLCGLDIDRQVSVLRMLHALQRQTGLAILYLTVDPLAATLLAHDMTFLVDGCVVEQGTAADVFEVPQRAQTRRYLDDSLDLEMRARGKGLRDAFFGAGSVFVY
jgi:ABC-type glutathione transport system ATPase component